MMLLSFSLIFIVGLALGKLFEFIKLPKLIGFLVAGVLIGPYGLNLLDSSILLISAELRKVALVIILIRAGLSLNIEELRRNSGTLFLLCFIPACFEIAAFYILGPLFFGLSSLDSLIMGCTVAAVSPAVIIPRMIRLQKQGYGRKNGIPQLVMVASSVDDIFVIILFTSFLNLAKTGDLQLHNFLSIPISIFLGLFVGAIIGYLFYAIQIRVNIEKIILVILFLSLSFALLALEDYLTGVVGFSGLLSIMAFAAFFKYFITNNFNQSIQDSDSSTLPIPPQNIVHGMEDAFGSLWIGAQIWLFVLVGATVNLASVSKFGFLAAIIVILALCFRIIGVIISLSKTIFNRKERLFIAFSYLPKATVQAAIGGLPLASGLESGDLILTVAVLSIIITAPLGAFLIDYSYKHLLQ